MRIRVVWNVVGLCSEPGFKCLIVFPIFSLSRSIHNKSILVRGDQIAESPPCIALEKQDKRNSVVAS